VKNNSSDPKQFKYGSWTPREHCFGNISEHFPRLCAHWLRHHARKVRKYSDNVPGTLQKSPGRYSSETNIKTKMGHEK